MPGIYFFAAFFMLFQIATDRWFLFNMRDLPIRLGDRNSQILVKIVPIAAVLHTVQGAWCAPAPIYHGGLAGPARVAELEPSAAPEAAERQQQRSSSMLPRWWR